MRSVVFFIIFIAVSTACFGQTRQEAIENFNNLRNQLDLQEKVILAPAKGDLSTAARENVDALRLLPRETYDGKLNIRGGGAYYAFTKKIQAYNNSDIELSQGQFSVGFAGCDYGFLYDLGELPLAETFLENESALFLNSYRPPTAEPAIRLEQRKAFNYEVNGLTYKSHLAAVVGHTYLLRSINFDSWDVLVAFRVQRKDADGSMILFWKILKEFEIPQIERDKQATSY